MPYSRSQSPRPPAGESEATEMTWADNRFDFNNPMTSAFDSHIRMATPNPGAFEENFGESLSPSILSNSESFGSSSNDSRSQSLVSLDSSQAAWSSSESNYNNFRERCRFLEFQLNEARQENLALQKRNIVLETKVDTLSDAYMQLVKRVPGLPTPEPQKKEDHPNVDYWERLDWVKKKKDRVTSVGLGTNTSDASTSKKRGKGRAAEGVNVTMQFVQYSNGEVIDGIRASKIRQIGRAFFKKLTRKRAPPSSWGDADYDTLQGFYHAMETHFPELGLCSMNWKADAIATSIYPHWYAAWLKKKDGGNGEDNGEDADEEIDINLDDDDDNDDDDDDDDNGNNTKNCNGDRRKGSSKKARTTGDTTPARPPLSSATHQQTVPTINVIPGTPMKPIQPSVPVRNVSLLQPQGGQPVVQNTSSQQPHGETQSQYNFVVTNPLGYGNPPLVPNIPPRAQQPSDPSSLRPMPGDPNRNPWLPTATFNQPTANPMPNSSRKGARMRPNKSETARNLCAIEWCNKNKLGTSDEFDAYWKHLTPDESKVYHDRSAALKVAKQEQQASGQGTGGEPAQS